MKAAVLHQFGETPRYEDFPDPAAGDGEILVHVRAVALENIDRMIAQGTHYAARQMIPALPAILGFDGIGALEDGQVVGFGGVRPPFGAMCEMTVIKAGATAPIPEGIDPAIAAAAPSSTLTALLPLKLGVKLQPGQSVLINGATGFAGRLAVQVAKLLGAGRVVGAGRDAQSLAELPGLGADAVIDLKADDEAVVDAFAREKGKGYDIILDFVWGRPTELLLRALTPHALTFPSKMVRLVHIGEGAGDSITLRGDALRTSGLSIMGAGGIPTEAIPEAVETMWGWLKEGRLRVEIERVPLSAIGEAWARRDLHGRRLVITP